MIIITYGHSSSTVERKAFVNTRPLISVSLPCLYSFTFPRIPLQHFSCPHLSIAILISSFSLLWKLILIKFCHYILLPRSSHYGEYTTLHISSTSFHLNSLGYYSSTSFISVVRCSCYVTYPFQFKFLDFIHFIGYYIHIILITHSNFYLSSLNLRLQCSVMTFKLRFHTTIW